MFQASHSREAERGADQMTIDVMRKLGRSPKPMGEFLLRVTGKEKGKGGATYMKNQAFCLETQHFPDSVNHANFPSTILKPGQTYASTTVHKFATK